MATTILIVCPECRKQIKAPENAVGKKVRCKFCQASFVAGKGNDKRPSGKAAKPAAAKAAKAPPSKAAPAKPAKPDDDEEDNDPNPYGMIDVNLSARCPHCANEMESEDAVVCLICGYNTRTRQLGRTRNVYDLTRGQHFIWLSPGIACFLVVLTVIGFNIWYLMRIDKVIDWETDPWYLVVWRVSGIKLWVVIMSIGAVWYAGKFAVKRLILHPKPPEVEKLK